MFKIKFVEFNETYFISFLYEYDKISQKFDGLILTYKIQPQIDTNQNYTSLTTLYITHYTKFSLSLSSKFTDNMQPTDSIHFAAFYVLYIKNAPMLQKLPLNY
jgi:hypothetical protein